MMMMIVTMMMMVMKFDNPQMILSNLWLLSGAVSSVLSGSYETDAIQRTTTAVTMFNAGFKENVMPSSAEVIHLPIFVHCHSF